MISELERKLRSYLPRALDRRVGRGKAWVRLRVPPGVRLVVGLLLLCGGVLGFLPVLGFWMIPLGLSIMAMDWRWVRQRVRGSPGQTGGPDPLIFRPYCPSDAAALKGIFLSNCPKYFHRSDLVDFTDFLERFADPNYLVVKRSGQIIGCGGHFTKNAHHGIAWVMFAKSSIGPRDLFASADRMFQEIETRIRAEGTGFDIRIETTQKMERLLRRYGFETCSISKAGFGPGLDRVVMTKPQT